MYNIVFWRKDDKFDQKSLPEFTRELVKQAKLFDELFHSWKSKSMKKDGSSSEEDGKTHIILGKRKLNSAEATRKSKKSKSNVSGKVSSTHPETPHKKFIPKCLNPDCDEHYWLKDCKIISKEKKVQLYKEYRESRARSKVLNGSVRHLKKKNITRHSALFTVTFSHGGVEVVLLADQGSDPNLISPETLSDLCKTNPSIVPM